MHFDALTVAAVAAELQQTIEEGRVQQVLAVDENSIGMEIYAQRQRHYLLLCADPKASRVYLAQEKLRRGVKKESPLLLLLRKYVRGGQLTAIAQPDPTERVLILHFFHPEHGATQLIAECITQRGN
ncbi:MAG: NFACT family protein, partial [Caldilineaceae bacterium]|nr:NFACT family protein [Caldilineaceae bacterium]